MQESCNSDTKMLFGYGKIRTEQNRKWDSDTLYDTYNLYTPPKSNTFFSRRLFNAIVETQGICRGDLNVIMDHRLHKTSLYIAKMLMANFINILLEEMGLVDLWGYLNYSATYKVHLRIDLMFLKHRKYMHTGRVYEIHYNTVYSKMYFKTRRKQTLQIMNNEQKENISESHRDMTEQWTWLTCKQSLGGNLFLKPYN